MRFRTLNSIGHQKLTEQIILPVNYHEPFPSFCHICTMSKLRVEVAENTTRNQETFHLEGFSKFCLCREVFRKQNSRWDFCFSKKQKNAKTRLPL